MATRYQTGKYEPQIGGFRAFVPRSLPPVPTLGIDREMQSLLSAADRALGRLDGSIQTLPNPDLFVLMYVRKEAVLSSQIEGTQASLSDVLEAEAKVLESDHPKDVNEVLNYVSAMRHGLKLLNELPVSTRLIRNIHERLMARVRGGQRNPGEIRNTQNWVGPQGAPIREAIFIPPPPNQLEDCLRDLEAFLNTDDDLPPLVKFGLAHAQFETIHPFLDGNGRMGRLLVTFLLCRDKLLGKPVLYLSHYFKRHRARYYDLLQGTRDNGDWESWLKFFLKGVAEVSVEATETAQAIVALRERHREIVTKNFGRAASRGLMLLEHLFRSPIVTVKGAEKIICTKFPAANTLIHRFVDSGILQEITGHRRNRLFRYRDYIRLFAEGRI